MGDKPPPTEAEKELRAEELESEVSELIAASDAQELTPEEVVEEIHLAAEAEAGVDEDLAFGRVGPRFDHRSPFYVGMEGAAGVAVIFALGSVILAIGQVLLLIALAVVIAVGLDPAVSWIIRRGLPRWAAVTAVLAVALGVFVGFLALAIPILITQTEKLATEIPHYLHTLKNHNSFLGRLNAHYHLVSGIQRFISRGGSSQIAGGVLGFGQVVLSLVGSVAVVVILAVYLLADLPRVKRGIYRFAPKARRARMVLLTNEILDRIGGYVLGNLLTSFIAGIGTWAWALAFGIPYGLLLGFLVALLDLIPVVGSTVGGIIVSLVALTLSLPVALATALFYTLYRFLEDYLLMPRIMARTVQVPGLLTVVATAMGGALFGIIGALISIPVAAGVKLLLEETTLRHLESG
ncbi:MAG TPA: AI-2E family transporter [Solirubrobacteraceae bacterium]|nr:AI-2E family transporter [Solirubrobacteraceae bacterium]